MVSDFVDTEPLFETNENEIESITAIKFEIEYGQENNCFFDSTQESFHFLTYLSSRIFIVFSPGPHVKILYSKLDTNWSIIESTTVISEKNFMLVSEATKR